MSLGSGGKSCDLFMPDMDPFDLVLTADRVCDAVQAVADNTVNALHPGSRQGLDELICNCHDVYPFCSPVTSRMTRR